MEIDMNKLVDDDDDGCEDLFRKYIAMKQLDVYEIEALKSVYFDKLFAPKVITCERKKKDYTFSNLLGLSVFVRDYDWHYKGKSVRFALSPLGAVDLPRSYYDQVSVYEEGRILASRGSGNYVVEYVRPKIDGKPVGILKTLDGEYAFVAIWVGTGYRLFESDSDLGHRAELVDGIIYSRATRTQVKLGSAYFTNKFVRNYAPSAGTDMCEAYDEISDGMILGINGMEYKLKWVPTVDLMCTKDGMVLRDGRIIFSDIVPEWYGEILEYDLEGNLRHRRPDKTRASTFEEYQVLKDAVTVDEFLTFTETVPSRGMEGAPSRYIPSFQELADQKAFDEESAVSVAFFSFGYPMTSQTAKAFKASPSASLLGIPKVVVQEFIRATGIREVGGVADLGRRPEYAALDDLYARKILDTETLLRFILPSDFSGILLADVENYIRSGVGSRSLQERLDAGEITRLDCEILVGVPGAEIPDIRFLPPADITRILYRIVESTHNGDFLSWHGFLNAIYREGFRFKFSMVRSFLLRIGYVLIGARYLRKSLREGESFSSKSRDYYLSYALTYNAEAIDSVEEEIAELAAHLDADGVEELGDVVMAILRSSDGSRAWKYQIANIVRDTPPLAPYREKLMTRLRYTDCPRNPGKPHTCPIFTSRDDARRALYAARRHELYVNARKRALMGKPTASADIRYSAEIEAECVRKLPYALEALHSSIYPGEDFSIDVIDCDRNMRGVIKFLLWTGKLGCSYHNGYWRRGRLPKDPPSRPISERSDSDSKRQRLTSAFQREDKAKTF